MKVKIRNALFSDFDAVGALKKRNGLDVVWSESRWLFLWSENPVFQSIEAWPIGWVLETEEKIVGYLGNIPLRYWCQSKPLLVAASRGFAVDPEYREHTLKLIAAFYSQKTPSILLSTTANKVAAKVYKLARSEPLPYADYDESLFWVTSSEGFLSAMFQHLCVPCIVARIAAFLAQPALSIWLNLRGHGPRHRQWSSELTILRADEIGSEFDELWERKQVELSQTLLADRSSASLRWHFGHSGAMARQAQILVARQNKSLVGYIVLIRMDSQAIGLKRYCVADLFVENDTPEVIDALLELAYTTARKNGIHMVEWVGFPERVRTRFTATAPLMRKLSSCPFWYKAIHLENLPNLDLPEAWYASLFDGDGSL